LNTLGELIRSEIAGRGPIGFDRFMELALYHPEHGYYERGADRVGKRGDFYTSVSIGSLFGELLGFQFAEWLEAEPGGRAANGTERLQLVEAGAHDGRLAQDILGWLRDWRPEILERTEYWIIEPSARRREWQRGTLVGFAPKVRWFVDWPEVLATAPDGVNGVAFSNELLDAFPVRRFGWDATARQWFEWGVAYAESRFVWTKLPFAVATAANPHGFRPHLEIITPALETVLPDHYTVEICPATEAWWRSAAGALACGHLLTFDYGLIAEELIIPERTQGTLRAYREHHGSDDILASPGDQDLTAHVNFAALQGVGEAAGLKTEGLFAQSGFLAGIAGRTMRPDARFGEWTQARARQFQTLTHPEHLGRTFRVLSQRRR